MRAPIGGAPRGDKRPRRTKWLLRVSVALMAFAAVLSGGVITGASPATALPRGEVVSFAGGLTISNFILPGGKRAYCIEVVMGEPTGQAWSDGRLSELPGRAGLLSAWGPTSGMRQMNYLIDRYGQTRNAWTSAAVQLTIWRMRENFLAGNPLLNQKIAVLQSSERGRKLIARSDQLYADAKSNAKAPTPAPAISGKLSIAPDPSGRSGRYRVAYPAGTVSLSATGGTFVRNGKATLSVSAANASARYLDVTPGATQVKVSGSWNTVGKAGWDAKLDVYSTSTATGGRGQRIAVATGKSSVPKRTGTFAAVTATPPPPPAPPIASSQAQPSAEVGGTMKDELRVRAQTKTTLEMWPSATASFTAYLLPTAGAPKYTPEWAPLLGDPYEAQMEHEASGEPLWHTWWANAQGDPLRDAAGDPISVTGDDGLPTTGVAADGTAYPVPKLNDAGDPLLDDEGNPLAYTAQEPVLEERRDPLLWTEEELAAMSADERCLAQPVYHEEGIAVPGPGNYSSSTTRVRTGGTVHWVERVYSRGKLAHEGECGLANETTRINQPGVVTQAPAELMIGEQAYDTATISGTLLPNVTYTVRFEAYRAPEEVAPVVPAAEAGGPSETVPEAVPEAVAPSCTAENIVFRSERVPVTQTGDLRSPGFILGPHHGAKLWWIETLEIDEGNGPRTIHRGVCGLDNETTRISQPTVETQAMPEAVIGDHITDTAIIGGDLAANDGAAWELEFRGYQGARTETTGPPICDASTQIFAVPPVAVVGPGPVTSAPVVALPEWRGEIWWVETLWLVQGDDRVAFATGECGITNETTLLAGPEVVTRALPLATVGDAITDTATVTGPLSTRPGLRHEIRFEAYRGDPATTGTPTAQCTADNLIWASEPIEVSEPGDVESPPLTALPAHGDTIWWVESLWLVDEATTSDGLLISRGTCGVEHETTHVQSPNVATIATAEVRVGEPLFDTAIVEGALSQREDIEYRVRFTAYERPSRGEMTCHADTEIAALSDPVGVAVTKAGRYESKPVIARAEHVGLGGYVETLVLIEDGQEHLVHRGTCGAASENFEIVPVDGPPPATPPRGAPDLPRTGSAPGILMGAGALSALVGLAAIVAAVVRRREKNS